jgi:hypothetical protein
LVVRKRWLLLAILGILVALTGCGQDSEDIQSIQAVRYVYESDGESMIPQPIQSWTLTDKEELTRFMTAMQKRTKADGKIDIRPRDYSIHLWYADGTTKEYDLWLDDDIDAKGVLMQGDMTWLIDAEANQALQGILR